MPSSSTCLISSEIGHSYLSEHRRLWHCPLVLEPAAGGLITCCAPGCSCSALVAGLALIASGGPRPVVIWLLGFGLVLTLGVAYERVHYKSLAAHRPGPGWGERTEERFIDPATGKQSHRLFPEPPMASGCMSRS